MKSNKSIIFSLSCTICLVQISLFDILIRVFWKQILFHLKIYVAFNDELYAGKMRLPVSVFLVLVFYFLLRSTIYNEWAEAHTFCALVPDKPFALFCFPYTSVVHALHELAYYVPLKLTCILLILVSSIIVIRNW